MFGASAELASVMEFGFKGVLNVLQCESKKGCHPIHGYNFVNS